MHLAPAVLQKLGLSNVQQDNRASHSAHIERLIVLVQHKDRRANHLGPPKAPPAVGRLSGTPVHPGLF